MHVLLVRHGRPETVINSPTIADPGLTELGQWQAERLAHWLTNEDIDQVITSPKRRAIETVHGVFTPRGLEHQVVEDFNEIDLGSHTYHPTELLSSEGGEFWDKIVAGQFDEIGWDHPDVFNARVLAAWQNLCRNPPGERIVVGCHGGTIRVILAAVAGHPGASFRVDYASISRIEVAPSNDDHPDPMCQIISTNETGHFDAQRTEPVGPMRDGGVVPAPWRRNPLGAPKKS